MLIELVCLFACVRGDSIEIETEPRIGPSDAVAHTSHGIVIGQRRDGYDTYFGIPYGQLNEKAPFGKSLTRWPNFTGPFYANDTETVCPQINNGIALGKIQCLTLNIYAPHGTEDIMHHHPVLVWLHGESFTTGNASKYDGQHLAKEGIVVVTVNFRLGVYGFFCLQNAYVPGNQALRDQIKALKWVQREIKAFGGDPNAVTLGGAAFGGGYVDLHLYSSHEETLFDQVIIQSGSIFNPGFFLNPNPRAALVLAKYFGQAIGTKTESQDVLPTLNRQDPLKVMEAAEQLNITVGVCREMHLSKVQHIKYNENFNIHDPYHLELDPKIKRTKILIGYNSMEMLHGYATNTSAEFFETLQDVFYQRLMTHFNLNSKDLEQLVSIMREFYLGEKPVGPESIIELAEAASDFYINHPVEQSINRYLEAGTTIFKYLFSYTGGSRFKHIPGSGAPQLEELKYLFEWTAPIVGDGQMVMRNRLTSMWANFIKYGNPTANNGTVKWVPMLESTRPYLDIDVNMTMRHFVFKERLAFTGLLKFMYERKLVNNLGGRRVRTRVKYARRRYS